MNYEGTIIRESLKNSKEILEKVFILETKISPTTEKSKTPWLTKWTLHKCEIAEEKASEIASLISKEIEEEHATSWYADFKNETTHYIIFRNQVFKIDRKSKSQYEEAENYGLSLGIPSYQLNLLKDFVA